MSAPLPPGIGGPAPATGPTPASPGLVPLADVMIRALPDRLAGLDRALVISGQVVEQKDGQATIRTAAGDVTVETPAPLPTDRTVTLRIPPQVPGTPPRAAALAPPQTQAPTPASDMPATGKAAAAQATAAPAPQTLPQIQPGATIAAIVIAAQPRPPSPPPPVSTANAAAGATLAAPVAVPGTGGGQPAPGLASSPASTPPLPLPAAGAPVPAPVAAPAPATQPASLPSLAALLGDMPAVAAKPAMAPIVQPGTVPQPAPAAAEPVSEPATDAAAPTPAPPPAPRTDAPPAPDAARLARLARYNISSAPSSGLFSFQNLDGVPANRTPQVDARLRGVAPPLPPTAPPTIGTQPAQVPAPAGTVPDMPIAPPRGPAPVLPQPGAPAEAPQQFSARVEVTRLRDGAAPSPPTAPPTAGEPAPKQIPQATGPRQLPATPAQTGPDTPPKPASTPDFPPAPVKGGTQPQPAAASPGPVEPKPQAITVAQPDAGVPAKVRDGQPPSPPTAPPTGGEPKPSPAPSPAPPDAPQPQAVQAARVREAQPPPPPTAPPTAPPAGGDIRPPSQPLPTPPPAPTEAVPPQTVQVARARETLPLSLPTAPPTVGEPKPAPLPTPPPAPQRLVSPAANPPAQTEMPGTQLARARDGQPPAPATALPTGGEPTPAARPAPPEPPPAMRPPQQQPAPEPGIHLARARGDAPPPAPPAPTAPPTGGNPAPTPIRPETPAPLPNGQPVQLRVLAVDTGGAQPAIIAADAPTMGSMPGTLVGNTAQGQPVVTTPLGTLVLRARTDLPPGTNLTLALEIPQNRDLAFMLPPLDPAQGTDWPAMREAMAALVAADPVLARNVAGAILPQPNKRLTTNLIFFLSALRGGDAAGWLGGEATELLRGRGDGRLLAQLREDFQAAARQAAEPTPDGWRAMPIPFGTPDQVTRAQLHVRSATDNEGDERRDDGRGPAKRFLLDLSFSRIGPMQLDGLVWPGRFDLMIRTQSLLPAELRQSIGTVFRDSLETVGFAGTIGFQTGAHFWARVQSANRGTGVRA